MKRIRTVACFGFAIIFLFSVFAGSLALLSRTTRAESVYVPAKAMCVMDAGSKRTFYTKNEDERLAMASTTKIMTAITAIENCEDLDKSFEISPKAVGISGTSIYLRNGEVMTTRDLLYGLMLVSGNDASVAIGEHVGGGIKNFVELMNATARKIGAFNTHFDNTHGLDSKTHYTTAYDLALITSYALQNPTFKEIASTQNIKITSQSGKTRYLRNKNKLLFTLDGCCGVKTGYTGDAGRCLVSACERNGMTVVAVVLNCGPMFEESRTLLEMAHEEYELIDLTKGYELPNSIKVEEGKQENLKIGTTGSFLYPMKKGEEKSVSYVYNFPETIEAPIKKGDKIGEVQIFINNNLHFTEKIYTMEEVRRKSIFVKIQELIDKW